MRSIPLWGKARADFEAMVRAASEPLMLSSGVLAPAALPQRRMPEFEVRRGHEEPCQNDYRSLFAYVGEERAVLLRTGWTGEILDGQPVMLAAVLRRGHPGQSRERGDADLIAFLCPWAAPGIYSVHRHGTPKLEGSTVRVHRVSHCAAYSGGYFLRLFDPQLPRIPWK